MPAHTAEDGLRAPLLRWPDLDRVPGQSVVALLASIVAPTALHPDRDDIEFRVVMRAAGLSVESDPMYLANNLRSLHSSNLQR